MAEVAFKFEITHIMYYSSQLTAHSYIYLSFIHIAYWTINNNNNNHYIRIMLHSLTSQCHIALILLYIYAYRTHSTLVRTRSTFYFIYIFIFVMLHHRKKTNNNHAPVDTCIRSLKNSKLLKFSSNIKCVQVISELINFVFFFLFCLSSCLIALHIMRV